MPALILASSSPRRRDLLRSAGVEFSVLAADVDESVRPGESPIAYVERVAHDKAMAIVARLGVNAIADIAVLAADTTVEIDGEILGKPVDDGDAQRMLRLLSGRTHHVHTAVLGWRATGIQRATVSTDVTFAALDDADVEWYLSLGEHRDKAGAYGMQDSGGVFVARIDGSPTNVIGLPLAQTIGVLRACGVVAAGS